MTINTTTVRPIIPSSERPVRWWVRDAQGLRQVSRSTYYRCAKASRDAHKWEPMTVDFSIDWSTMTVYIAQVVGPLAGSGEHYTVEGTGGGARLVLDESLPRWIS